MKDKTETEFPILLEPKKSIKKILILYIEISGSDEEDYHKTIKWMKDIEFSLKLRTKNNNIERNITYKVLVPKNDIENFREKEFQSNKQLNECLKELEGNP